MKKFFSFFAGALVGGLIGAVVALMYAPTKGAILRQRIQDYALEVTDEVKQAAVAKKEELESKLAQIHN